MAMSAATKETFLAPGAPQTGKIYNFMEAHAEKNGSQPSPQFSLAGEDGGPQLQTDRGRRQVVGHSFGPTRERLARRLNPGSTAGAPQRPGEAVGGHGPTNRRLPVAGN